AAVADGLLELYTATGEARYLERAEALVATAVERFADRRHGGFFFTALDAEQMVAPRKELDDNPTPSGNSLMATLLVRLGRLHGDAERERTALDVVRLATDHMRRVPHGFGQLLQAANELLAPPREVAVVGPRSDPATAALGRAA